MQRLCCLSVFLVVLACGQKLPTYNIDTSKISTSGISSGGFMAVQMYVAYSSLFQGLGVFSAGPYHCAEGSLKVALAECTDYLLPLSDSKYIKVTDGRSGISIDLTKYMFGKNAFILHGDLDTVVSVTVVNSLVSYLEHYGVNVTYKKLPKAEHCQPTDNQTNQNCEVLGSPYISFCNYDGAGVALQTIFSYSLSPRNNGPLSGTLLSFDQSQFGGAIQGMGPTGYLYVPKSCENGELCSLHVALHGCKQNVDFVGLDYVLNTGYNLWADANNMVVLYPQTLATDTPYNPMGCWDWWGYTDPLTYDVQDGAQMTILRQMISQISGTQASNT